VHAGLPVIALGSVPGRYLEPAQGHVLAIADEDSVAAFTGIDARRRHEAKVLDESADAKPVDE
jgi:hypothetical protein